jgi:hypothetical protein
MTLPIERLVAIYAADGGLSGELKYVLGKLSGRAHCSLCDITHSPIRRKREWDDLVRHLGVPVDLVHRNEVPPNISALGGLFPPAVYAITRSSPPILVLAGADLEPLAGSVNSFGVLLQKRLKSHRLALP